LTHLSNGVQPNPYVQYTDAVVAPKCARREDWWIIAKLEAELGLDNLLQGEPPAHRGVFDAMLSASRLSVDALRRMPHQTAVLGQPARETFFEDLVAWPDQRVDCCPPAFSDALLRCAEIFCELAAESPDQLKMISLRTHYMHNGSLANMKSLKSAKHGLNPLHMHPQDAERKALREGDRARIFNRFGSVTTHVTLDDTLLPGVVALSHGYGHESARGLKIALAQPGVNVNRLMPTGLGTYENLSNMSHMNGVPVEIERV
jgi:formate dehydrogenase